MTTAILCTVLLGLLLFGLGLGVSLTRGSTNATFGYTPDPTDRLYKMIRAHGNTSEYAPMLAVLMLLIGSRNPALWILWVMGIATLSPYLLAAGILLSPTLEKPHPLRFAGALGTYVCGVILCVAVFLTR